jgi:hypothetical protein
MIDKEFLKDLIPFLSLGVFIGYNLFINPRSKIKKESGGDYFPLLIIVILFLVFFFALDAQYWHLFK